MEVRNTWAPGGIKITWDNGPRFILDAEWAEPRITSAGPAPGRNRSDRKGSSREMRNAP